MFSDHEIKMSKKESTPLCEPLHQAVETTHFSPIAPHPPLDSSVSKNFCSIEKYKYQALCASSVASLQEVLRPIRMSYADRHT